jgi:hypothetical protein
MAVYRFYIKDSDGQLIRSARLECSEDSAAIQQAEHTLDGYSVEVWQLERRVGSIRTGRG